VVRLQDKVAEEIFHKPAIRQKTKEAIFYQFNSFVLL